MWAFRGDCVPETAGRSHDGNRGGMRGRLVGALCETAGFGASVSTCWAGNLNLVSRRVARAQEDGVGRVGHFFVPENIGCS